MCRRDIWPLCVPVVEGRKFSAAAAAAHNTSLPVCMHSEYTHTHTEHNVHGWGCACSSGGVNPSHYAAAIDLRLRHKGRRNSPMRPTDWLIGNINFVYRILATGGNCTRRCMCVCVRRRPIMRPIQQKRRSSLGPWFCIWCERVRAAGAAAAAAGCRLIHGVVFQESRAISVNSLSQRGEMECSLNLLSANRVRWKWLVTVYICSYLILNSKN